MKVAHFSTSHTGGGAIAARSLHAALLANNLVDSTFFAINQKGYSTGKNEYVISRSLKESLSSKFLSKVNMSLSSTSYFSAFSNLTLEQTWITIQEQVELGAVIHLHNTYNLISFENIMKLAHDGAKIILTLHDQRFFTGGCHYSLDCEGFKTDCANCPVVIPLIRSQVYANLATLKKSLSGVGKNLKIAAPSNWLASEASGSALLEGREIEHIPNYILNPAVRSRSAKRLSDPNRICIGIASMEPFVEIKGGSTIRTLIDNSLRLGWDIDVIFMSDFARFDKQSFWMAIDLLFVPSLADNSPNVIQEAKLIGLPILGRLVGGISELLDEIYDLGFTHDEELFFDFMSKVRALVRFTSRKTIQDKIIQQARERNNLSLIRHVEIYRSILK